MAYNRSLGAVAAEADGAALALRQNPGINEQPLLAILSYFPTNTTNSDQIPGVVNDKNNLDNFILKMDHRFNNVHSFAVGSVQML